MQRKLLLLCNPGYEECGNYVPQAIKIIEAYKQYFHVRHMPQLPHR